MQSISLTADPIADTLFELDLLKADLRIAHADLDELIWRQHLPAALLRAEAFTRRAIVQRSHRWVIDKFPYDLRQVLTLPRGKCASVTSIVVSQNGSPMTYRGPSSGSPAGTSWQEDLASDLGARLMPPRGGSWPWCDADVPAPVVITFVAGWTFSTLPAEIRRGLVMAIAEAVDASSPADVGSGFDLELPEKLLSGYRIAMDQSCEYHV